MIEDCLFGKCRPLLYDGECVSYTTPAVYGGCDLLGHRVCYLCRTNVSLDLGSPPSEAGLTQKSAARKIANGSFKRLFGMVSKIAMGHKLTKSESH